MQKTTDINTWLNENTVSCPVGKVSFNTCKMLQKRPYFYETLAPDVLLRPAPCAKCPGWTWWKDRPQLQAEVLK